MRVLSRIPLAGVGLILTACTTTPRDAAESITGTTAIAHAAAPAAGADLARAVLRTAAGLQIGTARFAADAAGRTHLTVHASGLAPGLHGVHLHAVGACVAAGAPAFASAGGHFNPTARQHGLLNPAGHHGGDLPNLQVNAAGQGSLEVTLEPFRLSDLFDADGTAIVIHADEDDQLTDSGPAGPGNSGARIACGALMR